MECEHAISGTECCWTFKQTCTASKIHRLHICKVFHGISYAVAQTWSQFRLPLCKRVIYSYISSTPKQDFRMPANKSIPTAFPGIPYGTWFLRCLGVSFWIFLFELCFGFILFLMCLLLQLMKRHELCIALAAAATWRLKMKVNSTNLYRVRDSTAFGLLSFDLKEDQLLNWQFANGTLEYWQTSLARVQVKDLSTSCEPSALMAVVVEARRYMEWTNDMFCCCEFHASFRSFCQDNATFSTLLLPKMRDLGMQGLDDLTWWH